MKIRFGVGLGADTAPDQLAGIVDHLETSGVDSLWFSELVYSPAVDPMVGMAYALARTTRLKVGTSVAVLPGRVIRCWWPNSWHRWRPSRRSGSFPSSGCVRRFRPSARCL